MSTMYRVFHAAPGCALVFCGARETYAGAVALAESEPSGLDESEWGTARAAGHVNGMTAPDGDDGPAISWHGEDGYYCVCRSND